MIYGGATKRQRREDNNAEDKVYDGYEDACNTSSVEGPAFVIKVSWTVLPGQGLNLASGVTNDLLYFRDVANNNIDIDINTDNGDTLAKYQELYFN